MTASPGRAHMDSGISATLKEPIVLRSIQVSQERAHKESGAPTNHAPSNRDVRSAAASMQANHDRSRKHSTIYATYEESSVSESVQAQRSTGHRKPGASTFYVGPTASANADDESERPQTHIEPARFSNAKVPELTKCDYSDMTTKHAIQTKPVARPLRVSPKQQEEDVEIAGSFRLENPRDSTAVPPPWGASPRGIHRIQGTRNVQAARLEKLRKKFEQVQRRKERNRELEFSKVKHDLALAAEKRKPPILAPGHLRSILMARRHSTDTDSSSG
jgi:hypothetical protein